MVIVMRAIMSKAGSGGFSPLADELEQTARTHLA